MFAQVRIIPAPAGALVESVTISRNGAWIGASTTTGSSPTLARYESGSLVRTDLGTISASTSFSVPRHGISDDGLTLAVNRGFGIATSTTHAYRWRAGSFIRLRDTNGAINTGAAASDMSADGERIVGVGPDSFGQFEAWVSTGGGMGQYVVTGPVGGPGPLSPSLSAGGGLGIWAERFQTNPVASYRWNGVSAQTISNGVRWSALTASGAHWAGFDDFRQLFTWDTASGSPIARGAIASSPDFITVDECVAGGSLVLGTRGPGLTGTAWVWTPATGITTLLMQYASGLGVDVSGWASMRSARVSEDGTTFGISDQSRNRSG